MLQQILPIVPSGANKIGDLLSLVREDYYIRYYFGGFQIGIHQTSIVTTMFKLNMGLIAIYMFNRWGQKNFFKYMLYFFNIDRLNPAKIFSMSEADPNRTGILF